MRSLRPRREHDQTTTAAHQLHINPFLGREKLCDLTAPRVYAFDGELRDAGRSLAMRKKIITNLKTILSFLSAARPRGGRMSPSPYSLEQETSPMIGRDETGPLRAGVDFPSRTELNPFWKPLQADGARLLITAMFTGMRHGRCAGFRGPTSILPLG